VQREECDARIREGRPGTRRARVSGILLALLAVAAGLAAFVVPAGAQGAPGADDRVRARAEELLERVKGHRRIFAVQRVDGRLRVASYRPADDVQASGIVRALAADDTTITVDADAPVHAIGDVQAAGTFDARRGEQWALNRTSFESAWGVTNGAGTVVAVLDTGVRADHEDLDGQVLAGTDIINGNNDGRTDPLGHGTHVAGIIAARANNGVGVAGAAPGARILPVRVLGGDGSGYMSDVAKGIIWATDHGANVISMSLGGPSPADGVRTAMQYARSKGVPVFVAAGNNALSGNPVVYPAAYAEATAVGSVDSNLLRSSFSGFQPYVDLAAPGGSILSTYNSSRTSYAYASGTSMATPYAAAAAALVRAARPDLSATGVVQALEDSAVDLGAAGKDDQYGFGLIDPNAAVRRPRNTLGGGTKGIGYWVVTADGRVRSFGYAASYGDLSESRIAAPVVAASRTKSGKGYYLALANGAVYGFGDAKYYGGMSGSSLKGLIVGMAVTRTGKGYYLLGSDGGVFAFGDAKFYGSTGNMRLNAPVLDMAVSRRGNGYLFVAADGGVFTFGDAKFKGSTGALRLAQPVRSMTNTATQDGYWLVARDGGMFSFGVPFHGSLPGSGVSTTGGRRVRAIPDGSGYYVLTEDGNVYRFGSARGFGSAAPLSTTTPAVDLLVLD
jgi:subtilisin family serine protease/ribosomal protein L24E